MSTATEPSADGAPGAEPSEHDRDGGTPMHASIWRFRGDGDDLLARYEAMIAEIPESSFLLHICLRGPDGLTVVDTCPSRTAFEEFRDADWFRDMLERHGLPMPAMEDHPVHVAFARGTRLAP